MNEPTTNGLAIETIGLVKRYNEEVLAVDEMKGEITQKAGLGESPWGKSAGIENLATDAKNTA